VKSETYRTSGKPSENGLTLCGADAHPCALHHCALPAKVSAIQAGLASGGGWARLTPTVSPPKTAELDIETRSDSMPFYRVQVTPQFTFKLGSDPQKYLIIKPGLEPQITTWIHWPDHCPCCGGENNTHIETQFSQRRPHWSGGTEETFYKIPIPYCQSCVDHIKSAARGIWIGGMTGLLVFAVLGAISLQTALSGLSHWVTVILFLLGAVGGCFGGIAAYRLYKSRVVIPMLQENCCSPFAAVNPGGCSGDAFIFFFRRKEYASEFAHLNGVNDIQEVKSISIGFT
jgi:hypothetical protein